MDAQTRLDLAVTLYARLDPRAHAVALFLLRHANPVGEWSGEFGAIAEALGVSWSTVARGFRALLSSGLINKARSNNRSATWQLVWQNCHIACYGSSAMATPPDPPSGAQRSAPSRRRPEFAQRSDTQIPGSGGGGEEKSFGDLTEEAASSSADEVRSLLVGVRNPIVRERIARSCSIELVRFAIASAETVPGRVRDPIAFAVHLLTSGSARAQREHNRTKAAASEAEKAARLDRARAALDQQRDESARTDAARRSIDQASAAELRTALAEALAELPHASRFHRLPPDAPEERVRKVASLSAYAELVAERLAALRSGEPRYVQLSPERKDRQP